MFFVWSSNVFVCVCWSCSWSFFHRFDWCLVFLVEVLRARSDCLEVFCPPPDRFQICQSQVLYRPISEGFGYKMLQKMGWKDLMFCFAAPWCWNTKLMIYEWFGFNYIIIREGDGESACLAIVCAANLQGVICIHAPNGRVWFQEGEGLGKEEKGLATPWLAASSCFRIHNEIRFGDVWSCFIPFFGGCVPTPPMFIPWFCWSAYLMSCHDWRNPRLGRLRLWVDPREGRSLPLRAGGFGLKDV